jgi:hypothetical protein
VTTDLAPGWANSRAAVLRRAPCEGYRDAIERGLFRGRNAMASTRIWYTSTVSAAPRERQAEYNQAEYKYFAKKCSKSQLKWRFFSSSDCLESASVTVVPHPGSKRLAAFLHQT